MAPGENEFDTPALDGRDEVFSQQEMGEGAQTFSALQAHYPPWISMCPPPRNNLTPVLWGFMEALLHRQRSLKSSRISDDQFHLQPLSPAHWQEMGPKGPILLSLGSWFHWKPAPI